MPSTVRTQRRYDHRLRELVSKTNSVGFALRHGVPRSTARGWLAPTATPVVTLKGVDQDAIGLRQEVVALRLRVDRLVALLRLMTVLLKLSGFSFARVRLPDGAAKARLLQAIDRSKSHFTLRAVLRIAGLSRTRYHVWRSETPCDLNDRPSCPRSSPQQLTLTEVETIRERVTALPAAGKGQYLQGGCQPLRFARVRGGQIWQSLGKNPLRASSVITKETTAAPFFTNCQSARKTSQ